MNPHGGYGRGDGGKVHELARVELDVELVKGRGGVSIRVSID